MKEYEIKGINLVHNALHRSRSLNFRLKTRDRFQSKASREPGASSKSDPSLDSVRCEPKG